MAFVSQEVNEAFHEIAGDEYDGEIVVEMVLLFSAIIWAFVQWIHECESQRQQIENLDAVMRDDPQDRSVYSGPEVSKEEVFGLGVRILP